MPDTGVEPVTGGVCAGFIMLSGSPGFESVGRLRSVAFLSRRTEISRVRGISGSRGYEQEEHSSGM